LLSGIYGGAGAVAIVVLILDVAEARGRGSEKNGFNECGRDLSLPHFLMTSARNLQNSKHLKIDKQFTFGELLSRANRDVFAPCAAS